MAQIIDLSKSVYELSKENLEIITIMKELGFDQITEPGMVTTVGRFMTIPKGAAMKKISMDRVIEVFEANGYELSRKEG